ncbi:MAG: hypothetical protein GY822_10620 [Deltaproteobacteria bacterium]|nr:hypothetical protein [Deltaproteobacteria bacterium]
MKPEQNPELQEQNHEQELENATEPTSIFAAPYAKEILPQDIQDLLHDDEEVGYWGQPIRYENGIGVWLVFSLGWIFTPAAAAAIADFTPRFLELASMDVLGFVEFVRLSVALLILSGMLLLLLFGVFLLFWPWSMRIRLDQTHVLMTSQRALHIRLHPRKPSKTKARSYRVTSCPDAKVVRQRGQSATLLLSEGTKEKKLTGKIVYECEAFHGIPRAKEALQMLHIAATARSSLKRGKSSFPRWQSG